MKDILSVYIPTLNEEINLPHCLGSVKKLGATIFVVDSNSTDRTVEIARAAGCQVVTGNWRTFSDKMNWAINELPIQTPWMLRIDADEWITDELVAELKAKLPTTPNEVGAFSINRKFYFLRRWIRFGGMYPLWSVRLWRTKRARCEIRELDEQMIVDGRIDRLDYDIVDENRRGLTHWVYKHNQYAEQEVKQVFGAQGLDQTSSALISQAARKRWLRNNVYYRMPGFLRPFLFWMYRYVFRLGFMDGIPGFVFHTMHGFWYRFLIDAKIYEVEQEQKKHK